MQIYLVGGAVRDELLGRPVGERDWVVVGATPEQMQQLGYRAVGRDFPVYLHPQTHEEYALARRERKVGPGYRGFTTQFSPQVTLEEDLQRRDLTINAMARDTHGRLIDPFGGQRDLERRALRHVSAAFIEDPVRILRTARFAARFAALGFAVAPETAALMRQMVDSGEVRSLVPERVWRELERALGEPTPAACLDTLQACGALAVLLPELSWGERERLALQAAVRASQDAAVRFAALLSHADLAAIGTLSDRLRVPNEFRELALLTARWWRELARARALQPAALLDLLEAADALRRGERFQKLLLGAEAAHAGACGGASTGTSSGIPVAASMPPPPSFPAQLLRAAHSAVVAVALPADRLRQLAGPAIAQELRRARERRLEELLSA
jgi:tRNA nucleotidyltransferase (CCA-adding enzyme)